MVITVWTDGSWKVWNEADSYYAQNDPNWLTNIPVPEAYEKADTNEKDREQLKAEIIGEIRTTKEFYRCCENFPNQFIEVIHVLERLISRIDEL